MSTGERAEMEIIDAQIIFHPREALEPVEMEQADRELAAIELALVAMQSVGVAKALWHGELDLCERAFARYPNVFRGVVYFADPGAPDVEDQVAHVAATPGLVSFRVAPQWPPQGYIEAIRSGAFDRCFAAAEKLDVPMCLFASSYLDDVPPIVERFPNLRIVIDHIGMDPPPHAPLVPERLDALPKLLALARYENVAVKFTGVAALSLEQFPFADLWPACRQILEAFGPQRVFWGSDFRRIRPLHPYRDLLDFLRLTNEVSKSDKRLMFSESLRDWFGWDDATGRRS